ncbi:MAG: hypothetical protein MUC88_07135 [Planctomycetes bacterium]|nr:hypothetical protein [Planctomycetota bacterium]
MRRARGLLACFTVGLVLSGLTAVPLQIEVNLLNGLIGRGSFFGGFWPEMASWISRVHAGISGVHQEYPFIAYGTDWLAFGHIVIAIAFLGAIRDPVRNIWVVEVGMIACVLVLPLALIGGGFRGIPMFWRLIDCSFGVFGIVPLGLAHRYIRRLAA